jgi:NADH dehydrogenase/putative oxidoreductase
VKKSATDLKRIAAQRRWIARPLGRAVAVVRTAERTLWPALDLVIRLWLAQVFFVSGLLKAANWDNALNLAANEYPVSWLDPVTAAWLGAGIEIGGAVLLAAGLATRAAAVAMLILSLIIQLNYRAFDAHLFWAVLFGWYAVFGAGPISLDRSLARGLADSALPLAASVLRLTRFVSRWFGPVYQLLLRLWLAAAMLVAAGTAFSGTMPSEWLATLLPVRTAAHLPLALLVPGASVLALGLGARVTAVILLLGLLGGEMTDPRLSDDWYWVLALALLAVKGAGRFSLDTAIAHTLDRFVPQLDGKAGLALEDLPRVVIVGAGFGGLTCAARLTNAPVRVTLIDRHNYHLFQPLLYQVATAGLSPGDIATPVRGLFRERFNAEVLLGEVTAVDTAQRKVFLGERSVDYDYLVLATGASHSYFGRDEWGPYAPGLKRIEDATEVRRRMLTAFEMAEATDDEAERRTLLTFLIVGGGPTGVELAGAIAELARHGMEKEFRRFDPATARVLLVQAAPRILPTFPEALSEKARCALERLGVEVLLNSRVERIDDAGVTVSGQRIPSRTVMWAAGVVASPAAKWLKADADNAGRVKVGPDLSVTGLSNVFCVGDTALSMAWNGQQVPGLAPAAKQGGNYVARIIRARVESRRMPRPFAYTHLGSLATIGRKAAVADFGWLKVWGAPAWWLWGAVHLGFLVGVRNRMSVMFDWFWAYLTYRSGTRLITGGSDSNGGAARGDTAPVRAVA